MAVLRPRVKRHVPGTVAVAQQSGNSLGNFIRRHCSLSRYICLLGFPRAGKAENSRARAVTLWPPAVLHLSSHTTNSILASISTHHLAGRGADPRRGRLRGLVLAGGVAGLAWAFATIEARWLGHAIIEGLVLAMLLGVVIRTCWPPGAAADPGIRFASRELLEVAVCLMGLSVDLPLLLAAGPALAVGVVLLVVVGLALSYGMGRVFGLSHKLAVLVACGNAICGNSAIAAVAPVIGADAEDVGSSIAFTAILGVAVVLGLPLLRGPLELSFYQYGVLTGLTVYAVPQVLAAAFPVSVLSGQVGTLVKLVRVLMLGPVVLFFAVRGRAAANDRPPAMSAPTGRPVTGMFTQFVPWFILGFLVLAAVRASGLVPDRVVTVAHTASSLLTLIAMAALGLACDLRAIVRAGGAIVGTVVCSLQMLMGLSIALIHLLDIR
ncbi:MAG: putative sulfate exporter family transporter [Phycisphaerae bacterium]|nr:putative sulfate exporter family transporter [Gemmatimonadaceae bacterium]